MAHPRHVVWLNDRAAPRGGAERYVLETPAALRAHGIRSTLLYDVASRVSAAATEAFDAAFPAVDLPAQLRDLEADVVYAHHLSDARWLDALVRSPVPVVRFLHDHALLCLREAKITTIGHRTCTRPAGPSCVACLGFVHRRAGFPGVGLRTLGSLREEQQKNRALARLVVGSRYMERCLEENGFAADRIRVTPLFARPPAAGLPDAPRARDTILFVGALTRGKGVDVLLDALARLPSRARLVIVGQGPQEQELRDRATRLGLEGRARFAGHLDVAALDEQYRAATCLVLPSRAPETFGLVGVEAMSHGTPVVATAIGGTEEWLEREKTGIAVPPDDPRALAAALGRLIADPELAASLGRAGRERWSSRFRPEHHAARLASVFAEVLA